MFLLILFFFYFFNISILFETQSMIHLFIFVIALKLLSTKMRSVKLRGIREEYLEWVFSIKFYITLKIWNTLLMRSVDIKLYKFSKFYSFIISSISNWSHYANFIFLKLYITYVRKCTLLILTRLADRLKFLLQLTKRMSNKYTISNLYFNK